MKTLLIVSFLSTVVLSAQAQEKGRIPAGTGPIVKTNATEFSQRAVQIKKDAFTVCSGYLNQQGWVVTAAQCFDSIVQDKSFHRVTVRFGVESLGETSDREIQKVVLHPQYKKGKLSHNLALLQFAGSPPSFALATDSVDATVKIDSSQELSLAGFGQNPSDKLDEEKNRAGFLRKTTGLKFSKLAQDNQFLVKMTDESRACHGDSGGPLLIKNKESYLVYGTVGVIEKNCKKAVFLNAILQHPYVEWFKEVAKSEGLKGQLVYDVKKSGEKPAREVTGLRP